MEDVALSAGLVLSLIDHSLSGLQDALLLSRITDVAAHRETYGRYHALRDLRREIERLVKSSEQDD